MRTLHLDTGREDRGGQRQLSLLVQGLAAMGQRPTVMLPTGAPLVDRLRAATGVQLLQGPLAGELSLAALPALVRLLRRERFALVHAHTAHAVTALHVARAWSGLGATLPLVAHRRVDFPLGRHALARRKRTWPDAWIAVSETVRQQLLRDGVDSGRVFVVPSAVDPTRLRPRQSRAAMRRQLAVGESTPLLLTVGQLVEHKGHRVALEALAAARSADVRGPAAAAVWVVAGEGPLLPALRADAARAGLGDAVRWLGPREDVADLLQAVDLLLFPSVSGEGSPAAPKEAMLAGVPVLASDLSACRELGLVDAARVPVGDVAAWAARLDAALRAPAELGLAVAAHRRHAERFTPQALCAATVTVYETVADRLARAGHALV